jgi:hypothetical protein
VPLPVGGGTFLCKTVDMPKLELNDDQLVIRLSPSEKLAALHGDLTVNGVAIRGAAVASKRWWMNLGLRVPGTAIPGVIIAGTYVQKGDRAFVSWTRKHGLPLEITLAAKMAPTFRGTKYTRILIGIEDAQGWADKINDAIVSC